MNSVNLCMQQPVRLGARQALTQPRTSLQRSLQGMRCKYLALHVPWRASANLHLNSALPVRRARLHVAAAAKKTEKESTKQEVFLGVKGNAQLLGMKGASVRHVQHIPRSVHTKQNRPRPTSGRSACSS